MRLLFSILICMLPQSAVAEVFKCVGKQGAVTYQPIPCDTTFKQQSLEIKSDPAKEAVAKAKLDEVRSEYKNRKAVQLAAEKQVSEQNYKSATLDLARSKVLALQEIAAERRRQTRLLKHQSHRHHKPTHKQTRHGKR